jgi:hypothetical protein
VKKKSQKKIIEKISDGLFDLENPLHNARHFAEVLRMIGSSDGMRGEPGEAIETLAQSLILILRDLQDKRESLCKLAFEVKGARDGRQHLRISRFFTQPSKNDFSHGAAEPRSLASGLTPAGHIAGGFSMSAQTPRDNSTVLQRRPFSKGRIVAIVDSSHCDT